MNSNLKKYVLNKTNLGNKNKFVLIIGSSPSKGARSPKLWNNAYKRFKKKIRMHPADVLEKNLGKICKYLKGNKNFLGSSVTIPFKEKIMKHLDSIDKNAKTIGSVNTIVRKKNKLIGYNTDYNGSLYSLKKSKITRKNKKILILGCGGAGKACIVSASNYFNNSEIILFNRSKKRLNVFLKNLKKSNKNKIKKISGYDKIKKLKKIDLIINTTSVGFDNWVKEKKFFFNLINYCPLAKVKIVKTKNKKNNIFYQKNMKNIEDNILNSIKVLCNIQKTIIFDIIYNPSRTLLLKIGDLFGHKNFNGIDMNLIQAVQGFKIVNAENKSMENILKAMQNG